MVVDTDVDVPAAHHQTCFAVRDEGSRIDAAAWGR
jgi:hypothetical protein